ncbi:MAG: phosphodiesterase YaeI [Bryobacteraceae bacterium]|nr:phosphodiesterase YaeI [Bryobacteraceae bacterium]
MNRRFFFGAAGAGLAALCTGAGYAGYAEPRWLEVKRTSVRLGRDSQPDGKRPVRILQLTDMHASRVVPMSLIEEAAALGAAEKPDLICLTGDFVTLGASYDAGAYTRILGELARVAPTVGVLGNHDGGLWGKAMAESTPVERMLERAGIPLLHNRWQPMNVRGQKFALAGVGDLWAQQVDGAAAFEGLDNPKDPVIVLAHNPDTKDELRRKPWDLMLCGHTHGGQVVLPVGGARFAPVRDKRYVAGLHPWNDGRLIYTSRGVGSLGGVRFRCRPEVTILDVHIG